MFAFVRSNESLSLFPSTANGTVADSWVAFLLPQIYPRAPGDTLVASYAWLQLQGYFVFAPRAPASLSAFTVTAWAWLTQAGLEPSGGLRPYLMWVKDPDSGVADFAADVARIEIPANGSRQGRFVASATNLRLGSSYTLAIYPQTGIDLDESDPDAPAFAISGGSGALALVANDQSFVPASPRARLPLAGPTAGCAVVGAIAASGTDPLGEDGLDVAMRYYAPTSGGLQSLRYPLFQTRSLSLNAVLDPCRPTDPARTRFTFPTTAPIDSYLRTPRGQTVSLTPRIDSTGFVLSRRPAQTRSSASPLYAVPTGTFDIGIAGGGHQPELLCGASGTETFSLPAGASLTFLPGSPALATFDPTRPLEDIPSPRLETDGGAASTAWASVDASAGQVTYAAQPQEAPLFAASGQGGSGLDTCLLDPRPLQVWPRPTTLSGAPIASPPVPLMPYAGLLPTNAAAVAVHAAFDRLVLAPTRRAALAATTVGSERPATTMSAGGTWTTDPHGLLVCVDDVCHQLDAVQLTATSASTSGVPLTLRRLQGDPLAVLQSQRVFLVATRAGPPSPGPSDPEMALAGDVSLSGWSFAPTFGTGTVDAGTATTLIVKLGGDAIGAQIARLPAWQEASVFNAEPAEVQKMLVAMVATARADVAAHGEASPYADFVTLLDDPNWNGALILNAAIGGEPPAIGSVLIGIYGGFHAFHLAVKANDVSSQDGALEIARSAISALVHYDAPAGAGPVMDAAGDCGLLVDYLHAVFRNSALVSLQCRIELALNRLFGLELQEQPPTAGAPAPPTRLILDGVYQARPGSQDGTYSFLGGSQPALTFAYQDVQAVLYRVLERVQIEKVQLAPIGEDATTVTSRFSLWGSFLFASEIPAIDVLNYDALVFSELALMMSAPRGGTGGQGQAPAFALLTSATTFDQTFAPGAAPDDPTRNQVRANRMDGTLPLGALVGSLPLRPAQLLYDPAAGLSAASLGFKPLDITATGGPQVGERPASIGLVFDLPLGGAGALASAGPIAAQVLIAWSLAGDLTLGLRLQGLGDGSQLRLEGVLPLTLGSGALEVITVQDGQKSSPWVALVLSEVSLSLLGKTFPVPPAFLVFQVFAPPGQSDVVWLTRYPMASGVGA